jgi:hypothetical protein
VRLFLRARLGVDTLDVLFGVGIRSFPHNLFCLTSEA